MVISYPVFPARICFARLTGPALKNLVEMATPARLTRHSSGPPSAPAKFVR